MSSDQEDAFLSLLGPAVERMSPMERVELLRAVLSKDVHELDRVSQQIMRGALNEELEPGDVQLLVCTWLPKEERVFDDDIEGTCTDCSTPIIYRPAGAAGFIRCCAPCAQKRMEGQ